MNLYGEGAETDVRPQCWRCKRTLAEYVTRPWSMRCRRCRAENRRGDPPVSSPEPSSLEHELQEQSVPSGPGAIAQRS